MSVIGNYSNKYFKKIYNASSETLRQAGFEIVLKGDAGSAFIKYGGKVTGERFDFVDYLEGNIFFDTFSEKETFVVKVWGATLMHELGIIEQDIYVAAMSGLVFENVAYISINYGIYANEEGTKFIKNMRG